MKTILTFVLLIYTTGMIYCHSGKPDYHVIIDTDGAIDDFRAINLFLASNRFEVMGITTSGGTLNPEETKNKVKTLLTKCHHEGIPVVAGEKKADFIPTWRTFCSSVSWGEEVKYKDIVTGNVMEFISSCMKNEKEKTTFICLGSLSSIALAVQSDTSIKQYLEKIVWYNHHDIKEGVNYKFNTGAYEYIINSGIPLTIISSENIQQNFFDHTIIEVINNIQSLYAENISSNFLECMAKNPQHDGYFKLHDELLPVYLLIPEAFEAIDTNSKSKVKILEVKDIQLVDITIQSILDIKIQDESKVFIGFPLDSKFYKLDVANRMENIIQKHGYKEWRAGVLTNELHGHLGIYAIIGTKMGLRVREFFNIGVDNIEILSYAGITPPISCMNDGLQVSTGGTLGHGLIEVLDSVIPEPKAHFCFKNRTVIMSLREEYRKILRQDIKHCINKYGLGTNKYWLKIRELALKYWEQWDRHKIFNLVFVG